MQVKIDDDDDDDDEIIIMMMMMTMTTMMMMMMMMMMITVNPQTSGISYVKTTNNNSLIGSFLSVYVQWC